jgi:hypothetical protein
MDDQRREQLARAFGYRSSRRYAGLLANGAMGLLPGARAVGQRRPLQWRCGPLQPGAVMTRRQATRIRLSRQRERPPWKANASII